ncbi:MAG: DMT family transporter [Blastocatellia bacterium]
MQTEAGNRLAYVHMLWGSVAFSAMGAFGHAAGESCSWEFVAVARTVIAFLLSLLIARFSGVKLVLFGPRALWARSIAGSIGLLGNFYALTHLPVSDALTISNTSPIWVALLGWAWFGDRPSLSTWMAVITGVLGVALIQQPHFRTGVLAGMLALLGALCTAIAMLGLNRLRGVEPGAIVAHFSGLSSLTTIAFTLFTSSRAPITPPQTAMTFFLLAMTGVSGVIGQMGMTMAFARGQAARVSVIILSQIFFALLFDVFLWRRQVNAISLLGMILVTAPTAWLILHSVTRRAPQVVDTDI